MAARRLFSVSRWLFHIIGAWMINKIAFVIVFICGVIFYGDSSDAQKSAPIWRRFETVFVSDQAFDNPLYDAPGVTVLFTAPSGRTLTRIAFWDGGRDWRVRFMPDETGTWQYISRCGDKKNTGLHGREGTFSCSEATGGHAIYTKGAIMRPKGSFHLAHADGEPFFWLGDTAWNGPLKSTDEEWDYYLEKRADQGYTVILCTATQWRGGGSDENGRVAFTGSGKISLDIDYFKRLDKKIDRINEYGMVAAPVLLWTLQFGAGRELSPGYYLPDSEAVLLARYMLARYGANHVVWMLGGDGRFINEYEQRWKNIGRQVFGPDNFGGIVTTHPQGLSWYGEVYDDEDWIDIIGYQSSHSTAQRTVEFITRGPASKAWDKLPPRPIMNLEPIYENILPNGTVYDVRKAMWWSVFATPVSGITYGANGIWSWLQPGSEILNHRKRPETRPWRESLDFSGGEQAVVLASFMRSLDWTALRPAQELLAEQPGDDDYQRFVSVLADDTRSCVVVYAPSQGNVKLYNPRGLDYRARRFDPVTGAYSDIAVASEGKKLTITAGGAEDSVILLER